jgi:D-tagatose-1,6-bisphosphate aldolase subunit GatZ/KbaZ
MCSAHPLVIEATLRHGRRHGGSVLIEATCNQVNQEGGYTGMTPLDFRRLVVDIAARVDFDLSQLILGGDHLGPNPWRHLPAEDALTRAEAMISAYVRAGFTKIHLDTSMGCRGEPPALDDSLTAERAARLARVAEAAAESSGLAPPVYVIGTEVPIPGGAHEALDELELTRPDAAIATASANRRAFAALGLERAFDRVIAIVVQPGVEFGNENVIAYDRAAARALSASLVQMPDLVFEAHSTDYQSVAALSELVEDGFAILKVGPGATFALREAYYGLDSIVRELDGDPPATSLRTTLEEAMLDDPRHWQAYYRGSAREIALQRHFSYSDRIRYYWPQQKVVEAVGKLLARLDGRSIPQPLIRQYLGWLADDVGAGTIAATPSGLLIGSIDRVLNDYATACRLIG